MSKNSENVTKFRECLKSSKMFKLRKISKNSEKYLKIPKNI